MKNIHYEGYRGLRLPRKVQLERVQDVIRKELTDAQREVLLAYYLQEMTIPQIARERGVNKSSVSKMLRRAEDRLRRFLRY